MHDWAVPEEPSLVTEQTMPDKGPGPQQPTNGATYTYLAVWTAENGYEKVVMAIVGRM